MVTKGVKVTLVLPETMMNASGKAVSTFIKTPKAAKNLLVIHDDLDLPLGTLKMVFGRGSGHIRDGERHARDKNTRLRTHPHRHFRSWEKESGKKVHGEEVIKQVIGSGSHLKRRLSKSSKKPPRPSVSSPPLVSHPPPSSPTPTKNKGDTQVAAFCVCFYSFRLPSSLRCVFIGQCGL